MMLRHRIVVSLGMGLVCCAAWAQGAPTPAPGAQADLSGLPSALLALQPLVQNSFSMTSDGAKIELSNLNASVGEWQLLSVREPSGMVRHLHIDAGWPAARLFVNDQGLVIERDQRRGVCALTTPAQREAFFAPSGAAFKALPCGVWARESVRGAKSALESATDLLRSAGPLGETLINWQKDWFPRAGDAAQSATGAHAGFEEAGAPINASFSEHSSWIAAPNLGIEPEGGKQSMKAGVWAPVQGMTGAWVSVASPSEAQSGGSAGLAYLVAVGLPGATPRYMMGVDHPSLGWSNRAPLPHAGTGPDGFDEIDPLRRVGVVPPWAQSQVELVFSGGFKREHSAFKGGPRASRDQGSHYGFVESGTQVSRLKPGLATLWQRVGEEPKMGPWSEQEQARGLHGLIFARQNGLPLLDNGQLGADLSAHSVSGNWSGDHEGNPETMRGAVCFAGPSATAPRTHLIYAVFSAAQPGEMAALLKSYGCQDAMQLDMNAPDLVYGALITHPNAKGSEALPLLTSMAKTPNGGRFMNAADTRDFFYWTRAPR